MGGQGKTDWAATDVHAFPTTHWSVVVSAREDRRGAALGRLVQMYTPALRTYLLLERRLSPQDVDDAIQGFVADRVLESSLLAKADPARGKFRSLLLAALNNHINSEYRRATAKKRAPEAGISSLDAATHAASADQDPFRAFNRAWAMQLLTRAQEVMRAECERIGRPEIWGVFRKRELAPIYEGTAPISYEAIVSEFGFKSPSQASNTIVTAKRMFDRILREIIREYATPEQVEDEIRDLFLAFSNAKS